MPELTLQQRVELLERKELADRIDLELLQRQVADLREALMQLDPNRPRANPATG